MALRSDPDLDAAHRLYGMGAFVPALDALKRVAPGPGRLLVAGACLARLRRGPEAVDAFTELLAQAPDCHEALTWMAILRREDPEEALGYARRAIALRPDDATGHGALGTLLLGSGQPEEAVAALERAVEAAPDVAEHRHNLALALLRLHRHGEAVESLRRATELDPATPHNHLALARTLSQFGLAGPTLDALQAGLRHLPDHAPLHTAAGEAFAALRNDEAAERHHRRAAALSPTARGGLGAWLLNQGRFDEADAVFDALVRDGSDPAFGYYGQMQSRKKADDASIGEMEAALSPGRLRTKEEMYLRYALGKAEEGRNQHGEAMAHYDAANRLAARLYHGGRSPDPARFEAEQVQARRLFEALRDLPGGGEPPDAPVFIVGMIRSGTTLLDHILSSHPEVASGGELRFWLEEGRRLAALGGVSEPLSPPGERGRGEGPVTISYQVEGERPLTPSPSPPEGRGESGVPGLDRATLGPLARDYLDYARLLAGTEGRFTDKMPLNFEFVGLIHLALPNARFLHIRRHPVDTGLSIWTTFFGQGPVFAYDKANIVAHYRAYQRAMAYWRETIPKDRLLELDYEDLIAAPEPTIRRTVGFCDLPWNDACLRHDQNQGAINTPSRWQARQPIYKTSVERWRRYEPWLGEFAGLLEEV